MCSVFILVYGSFRGFLLVIFMQKDGDLGEAPDKISIRGQSERKPTRRKVKM